MMSPSVSSASPSRRFPTPHKISRFTPRANSGATFPQSSSGPVFRFWTNMPASGHCDCMGNAHGRPNEILFTFRLRLEAEARDGGINGDAVEAQVGDTGCQNGGVAERAFGTQMGEHRLHQIIVSVALIGDGFGAVGRTVPAVAGKHAERGRGAHAEVATRAVALVTVDPNGA